MDPNFAPRAAGVNRYGDKVQQRVSFHLVRTTEVLSSSDNPHYGKSPRFQPVGPETEGAVLYIGSDAAVALVASYRRASRWWALQSTCSGCRPARSAGG